MQQSPSSEANGPSASQEIPCILLNAKVQNCLYNSLPHFAIHSQMNSVMNFA